MRAKSRRKIEKRTHREREKTIWITLRYCPVTAVMSHFSIVLLSRDIFGDVVHENKSAKSPPDGQI